jgi:alcohol dehydrogenase class IV
MNFNFHMPTRVIMDEDCILKNSFVLKDIGHKALIVTGAKSAKKNGSLQDVTEALRKAGIDFVIYDKVMSNPTVNCVYEGAKYAKENLVDFVIGIGGGSPMDAAKAIALLAVQDKNKEELFSCSFENKVLPLVMVPTTAGTGSEVTPYSILTNDMAQTKTSISTPLIFPKLALLDPNYMKNLSLTVTVNTAMDALSHSIEGMLSVRSTTFSDMIATESIKRITQSLDKIQIGKGITSGSNITMDIREKLLYGSMLAGIVITHTGTSAVHSMGYSLTYFKNIDHGRANALLLPSFLRFVSKNEPLLVKRILLAMEMETTDEFETFFLHLLGEREKLTMDEIERFAGIAIQAKNIVNSRVVPDKEDIIQVYTRSLHL